MSSAAAPPAAVAAIAACSAEITDLHVFFVDWFRGTGFESDADADAAFDAFLQRFSNDFQYPLFANLPLSKLRSCCPSLCLCVSPSAAI